MAEGNRQGAGLVPGWRDGPAALAAGILRNGVLVALLLLFLWLTIRIDLIIFAGALLAVFLRGLANLLRGRTGLPPSLALAAVILGIIVILVGIGWFFSASINSQINQLSQRLPSAFQRFQQMIEGVPWLKNMVAQANPTALAGSGGGASRIFGIASTTVEVIAGFVILIFIGLYTAAEPFLYERGFLKLVPLDRRARARQIVAETADTLWYWMLGRLFSMATIGVTTGVGLWIIGIPVPAALGMLAGILTFVPYVGTIASAIPPVLLGVAADPKEAIYVILLFVGIHSLEGYILVPLVQKRAAHLPPALTLAAQAILGSIIGFLGLALATPLVAAIVVLTRMIYVEDVLGDRAAGSLETTEP